MSLIDLFRFLSLMVCFTGIDSPHVERQQQQMQMALLESALLYIN